MPHHTAFVITSVTPDPQVTQPDRETLIQAAQEAADITQRSAMGLESSAIGSNRFRFIQGQTALNFHLSRGEPGYNLPPMTTSPEEPNPKTLANNWNTTNNLIALALNNPEDDLTGQPGTRVIPDILASFDDPDLLNGAALTRFDVFGDPVFDDSPSVAAQFLPECEPGYAKYLASVPVAELEWANHTIRYIRTLYRLPDHLVIQMDWNQ